MVQNPKGGGLSSSLGGSTQMGGVQKTTDFLDKSTWALGIFLIVLILFSSLSFPSTGVAPAEEEQTQTPAKTEAPADKPAAATPAPTATTTQGTPVEVTPVKTPAKK